MHPVWCPIRARRLFSDQFCTTIEHNWSLRRRARKSIALWPGAIVSQDTRSTGRRRKHYDRRALPRSAQRCRTALRPAEIRSQTHPRKGKLLTPHGVRHGPHNRIVRKIPGVPACRPRTEGPPRRECCESVPPHTLKAKSLRRALVTTGLLRGGLRADAKRCRYRGRSQERSREIAQRHNRFHKSLSCAKLGRRFKRMSSKPISCGRGSSVLTSPLCYSGSAPSVCEKTRKLARYLERQAFERASRAQTPPRDKRKMSPRNQGISYPSLRHEPHLPLPLENDNEF